MRAYLKEHLTNTDYFLIAVNLVPLAGVWFLQWDAKQMFLIYCLESVIAGLINVLQMLLTTWVKKKDIWENNGYRSNVSGYLFIFFFIVHYGFFIFIQMMLFFSFANINGIDDGFGGVFKFLFHSRAYLSESAYMVLLLFLASGLLVMLKNYVLSGAYKTASLGIVMFSPYGRIFVQQFVVIIGARLFNFGAGKIFMLVFVAVKIFFDVLLNYGKILQIAIEKRSANK